MAYKTCRPAQDIRTILSHDFVFGFLSLFAFILAYHALIPTLPIFFAHSGSNDFQIGILVGIFGFSSLVFRLIVGGALLKYSEKAIMTFGAALFTITFVASLLVRPFWPFFAVRFLQGIAFACVDTAALAFIVNITPAAHRTQAISYFVLAPPFSQAIAPSMGMEVTNTYGFEVLFAMCMALSVCSLVFSSKLRKHSVISSDKSVPTACNLFLDWRVVIPSMTTFLQNFIWGAIIAFLPLYALQCGVKNPGLFFTGNAIMLVAGRVLGGRFMDAADKEKVIATVIVVSIIAMIVISFSTSLPMFFLVGLIWGTGGAFIFPASMAYSLEYAGSFGGTAVGTFRAMSDLGLALGPMITGFIVPLAGYRMAFLCLAGVGLMNLCYFQFYVRKKTRIRRMRSPR
ncbi:MAG TPA: MFS transporter [Syntrophorhabdaceae bacterium]|nr:MFS transporter [Syntrophorhabdaceae bacterium]